MHSREQWADLAAGDMTQFRDNAGTIRACYIFGRDGDSLSIHYRLDCGEVVRGAFISIYDLVTDEEVASGA